MPEILTQCIPIEDPEAISRAGEIIRAGGLIVFPTDTLYGVACNPQDPQALRKLYAAKGRSNLKAIPVLISAPTQLKTLTGALTPPVKSLMQQFWPGALTLVLPKAASLPLELTPYPGLAVRMPDHAFALRLLGVLGPLAVTSANLSGQENPLTARGVFEQLGGSVDLILDGGSLSSSAASTIVDCGGEELLLLREGPLTFEAIRKVWEQA